jgi:hypothetical protein
LLAAGNNCGVDRPLIALSVAGLSRHPARSGRQIRLADQRLDAGQEILMAVKCPSCNLMFGTRNELDWHVREEHMRSRLPARTPPADDATAPADRTARVTVEAERAGPQAPPPAPDQPEPDTATRAPTGPRAWIRRLLRPSGTSRQPASLEPLQDDDEQR